jgi:hypothetical protein
MFPIPFRQIVPVPAALLLLSVLALPANAHYLWVTIDQKSGEQGTAKIYFEGGPAPGDGSYLDRFFKGEKTWVQIPGEKAKQIETSDINQAEQSKRWAATELDQDRPRSVESYFKFGVYQYGQTFVLLHYYAKNLDLSSHEDLHDLARSQNLALDMVPHDNADQVELTVLWQGEPAVDRTVKVRGPKGFQVNMQTDKNGAISFKPEVQGQYTFLTNVEEQKSGTDDGMEYQLIRHQSTLVMVLPLAK